MQENELQERKFELIWSSRGECVMDCAGNWLALDRAGWFFVEKVHRAKELYGDTVLDDIASEAHRSIKTLRNLVSLWNNPVRELAQNLDLSTSHVNLVAGIARDNIEQAEDYLHVAAERALSASDFRYMLRQQGACSYPASRNDEPPFCNEEHYRDQPPHEMELVITRSMAARDVAATLRQLDAAVLREVVKLLNEIDY